MNKKCHLPHVWHRQASVLNLRTTHFIAVTPKNATNKLKALKMLVAIEQRGLE
jgi:hypothetical protein